MEERREGERRSGEERRKGGSSNYRGPERRAIRYRRSDSDRRQILQYAYQPRRTTVPPSLKNSGQRF
jgi:hypothetical protein